MHYKMEKKQPLLSICIPTWNRCKFLELSLERLHEQLSDVPLGYIELYVSDNCSEDETSNIVEYYIKKGLPITYNRNKANIGASKNFLYCMQNASGKYILLLGDDDILNPGSLKLLLQRIEDNDYGLIHIHHFEGVNDSFIEYDNVESFYKKISYWFTFMSGSIFRKEIVDQIDFNKYVGTHLLQMPYYIASAKKSKKNLLINKELLQTGLDEKNNGGYNFYEVFVRNYLNIWHDFVDNGVISEECYDYLKRDIYVHYIRNFNYKFLVKKEDIKNEKNIYGGNRKGFKIEGSKKILKEYYGDTYYYYWYMFKMYLRKYINYIYHMDK